MKMTVNINLGDKLREKSSKSHMTLIVICKTRALKKYIKTEDYYLKCFGNGNIWLIQSLIHN